MADQLLQSASLREALEAFLLKEEQPGEQANEPFSSEALHRSGSLSREEFEALAESIPQLVWAAGPAGQTDFINKRCLDFIGTDAKGGTAHWFDALHPEDKDAAAAAWAEALKEKKVFECEYRLRSQNGTYRWFLGRAFPVLDSRGFVKRWFGTATDIEERKNLYEELKQQRDQLQIILKNVTEGITVLDRDHRFIFANDAAAELCGFSSVNEFLKASTAEIMEAFEMTDEWGRPLDLSLLPGRKALLGDLSPPELMVKFRNRKTGQLRWSIVNAAPVIGNDGQAKFAISVFRDFTHRRDHEEKLQLLGEAGFLFSSSTDCHEILKGLSALTVPRFADWITVDLQVHPDADPEPYLIHHSEEERSIWAHALLRKFPENWSRDFGKGKVYRTGASELYKEVTDHLLEEASTNEEHLRLLKEMGLRSIILVPLKSRNNIYGVIGFASGEGGRVFGEDDLHFAEDLAFRAGMAIENARLFHQAQDAVRLRDDFLALASHELKTPLTTLKLRTQAASRKLERHGAIDRSETEKLLDVVSRQTERLTRLVEDMLDVTYLNRRRIRLTFKRFSLRELLEELVTEMEPAALRSGCSIAMKLPAELFMEGDRKKVRQAIRNLICNAIKYGLGKPVCLVAEMAGEEILIRVKDQGIGIAEPDQERIFQRFERAVSANEVSGMGLGLFYVKNVVELHGGRIEVESSLGNGSEFSVLFPRAGRGEK